MTLKLHGHGCEPNLRKRLTELAIQRGPRLASLSAAIGRNPVYLQQFVQRGSPRRLPEIERLHLAIVLEVDERTIRGRR